MTIPDDLTEWRENASRVPQSDRLLALIDEAERLRSSLRVNRAERDSAFRNSLDVERQRDAALKVLRRLEWRRRIGNESCPWCHRDRPHGHAPDCALAAVLRGESE